MIFDLSDLMGSDLDIKDSCLKIHKVLWLTSEAMCTSFEVDKWHSFGAQWPKNVSWKWTRFCVPPRWCVPGLKLIVLEKMSVHWAMTFDVTFSTPVTLKSTMAAWQSIGLGPPPSKLNVLVLFSAHTPRWVVRSLKLIGPIVLEKTSRNGLMTFVISVTSKSKMATWKSIVFHLSSRGCCIPGFTSLDPIVLE